jgi:hypothetical protein
MRKFAFAAVGTALALSLVACGGKDGTATGQGQGGNGNSGGLSIMANVADLANQVDKGASTSNSAKITLDATMQGQAIKATGAYQLKPSVAMDMTMTTPEGDMRMVLIDNVLYIQLPEQARGQMGGKPWVKISADGDDPMSKMLGSMLTTVSDNVDVTKQIQQIKDAGTITKSAQENLDGQQVVHYWIDVDVQKLAALQKDDLTKTALESLAKQGTKTLKYELWVRGDGLPAKFSTQMPVGSGQPVAVTVGFTDWGKPVTVQAPPADQVGEMPKMGG